MRQYTDEERESAVALVAEVGLADAWRQLGIPKPTLVLWCQKAGVERFRPEQTRMAVEAAELRAANLRVQLRTMLLEKAVDLLERMDAPHVEFKGKDADQVEYPIAPAGAVQNYATSAAILIDKYRLEVGDPTERTETRDLSGVLNDHELDLLRRVVQRETTEEPATEAAVVSPSPEGPASA
jgi:transposase-like protein